MQPQFFGDEWSPGTRTTQTKQVLRVLIAYEDLDAGRRAMRVLVNLGKGLDEATEFQTIPWPFDVLTDLRWRDAVAREAADAEILMVATSGTNPLPAGVGRWFKDVIARKRGTEAAVVALFGPEEDPDGTGSSRLEEIRGAAQRAGLDFFAPTPRSELDEVVTMVHPRAVMGTPVLQQIHDTQQIALGMAYNECTP